MPQSMNSMKADQQKSSNTPPLKSTITINTSRMNWPECIKDQKSFKKTGDKFTVLCWGWFVAVGFFWFTLVAACKPVGRAIESAP